MDVTGNELDIENKFKELNDDMPMVIGNPISDFFSKTVNDTSRKDIAMLKGFGYLELGSGINKIPLNQASELNQSIAASDQYLKMNTIHFLYDSSLRFESEAHANTFVQKFIRNPEQFVNPNASDFRHQALNAFTCLNHIQQTYPHLATPELKQLEVNLTNNVVEGFSANSTEFDQIYKQASPEVKQMMGALQGKTDEASVKKFAELKSTSATVRMDTEFNKLPTNQNLSDRSSVNTGMIDAQQHNIKDVLRKNWHVKYQSRKTRFP